MIPNLTADINTDAFGKYKGNKGFRQKMIYVNRASDTAVLLSVTFLGRMMVFTWGKKNETEEEKK